LTAEKLGKADWIGEDKLDNDTAILKIKGPKESTNSVSILVRGSNGLVKIII
jgi:hypothetical protein